jgi:hypothetical protein
MPNHEQDANWRDQLEDYFLTGNPNPKRLNCLDIETLQAIARRDLNVPEAAFLHLCECSECSVDVRAYRERLQTAVQRRTLIYVLAASVLMVCGLAIWGLSRSHRQPRFEAAMINFATSISRGMDQDAEDAPVTPVVQTYPQRIVVLTANLPPGSDDGKYLFEIVKPGGGAVISAQGQAHISNGLTTFTATVNLSYLAQGTYIARVRRPPLGDWKSVPIQIQ